MQNAIKLLPQHVTERNRASTQITDLSVAVCELVRNAIEADARQIRVTVKAWSAEVEDDGCGIAADSLQLLGQRFCTSKPSGQARGEALSSLAQVCSLLITSRAKGSFETYRKAIGGPASGNTAAKQSLPSQQHTLNSNGTLCTTPRQRHGTTICLSNFLYNQPVRRKQTGGHAAALEQIRKALHALVLPHAGVEVVLLQGGSTAAILHMAKDRSLSSSCQQLFWQHLDHMHIINTPHTQGWQLAGCVIAPPATFSSTEQQLLYINRRSISCKPLTQLLKDWYTCSLRALQASEHSSAGTRMGLRAPEPGYVLLITCPASAAVTTGRAAGQVEVDLSSSMGQLMELLQSGIGPAWGSIPAAWRATAKDRSTASRSNLNALPPPPVAAAATRGPAAAAAVEVLPSSSRNQPQQQLHKQQRQQQQMEQQEGLQHASLLPVHGLQMSSRTRSLAAMQAASELVPCYPKPVTATNEHPNHSSHHQHSHDQHRHHQQQEQRHQQQVCNGPHLDIQDAVTMHVGDMLQDQTMQHWPRHSRAAAAEAPGSPGAADLASFDWPECDSGAATGASRATRTAEGLNTGLLCCGSVLESPGIAALASSRATATAASASAVAGNRGDGSAGTCSAAFMFDYDIEMGTNTATHMRGSGTAGFPACGFAGPLKRPTAAATADGSGAATGHAWTVAAGDDDVGLDEWLDQETAAYSCVAAADGAADAADMAVAGPDGHTATEPTDMSCLEDSLPTAAAQIARQQQQQQQQQQLYHQHDDEECMRGNGDLFSTAGGEFSLGSCSPLATKLRSSSVHQDEQQQQRQNQQQPVEHGWERHAGVATASCDEDLPDIHCNVPGVSSFETPSLSPVIAAPGAAAATAAAAAAAAAAEEWPEGIPRRNSTQEQQQQQQGEEAECQHWDMWEQQQQQQLPSPVQLPSFAVTPPSADSPQGFAGFSNPGQSMQQYSPGVSFWSAAPGTGYFEQDRFNCDEAIRELEGWQQQQQQQQFWEGTRQPPARRGPLRDDGAAAGYEFDDDGVDNADPFVRNGQELMGSNASTPVHHQPGSPMRAGNACSHRNNLQSDLEGQQQDSTGFMHFTRRRQQSQQQLLLLQQQQDDYGDHCHLQHSDYQQQYQQHLRDDLLLASPRWNRVHDEQQQHRQQHHCRQRQPQEEHDVFDVQLGLGGETPEGGVELGRLLGQTLGTAGQTLGTAGQTLGTAGQNLGTAGQTLGTAGQTLQQGLTPPGTSPSAGGFMNRLQQLLHSPLDALHRAPTTAAAAAAREHIVVAAVAGGEGAEETAGLGLLGEFDVLHDNDFDDGNALQQAINGVRVGLAWDEQQQQQAYYRQDVMGMRRLPYAEAAATAARPAASEETVQQLSCEAAQVNSRASAAAAGAGCDRRVASSSITAAAAAAAAPLAVEGQGVHVARGEADVLCTPPRKLPSVFLVPLQQRLLQSAPPQAKQQRKYAESGSFSGSSMNRQGVTSCITSSRVRKRLQIYGGGDMGDDRDSGADVAKRFFADGGYCSSKRRRNTCPGAVHISQQQQQQQQQQQPMAGITEVDDMEQKTAAAVQKKPSGQLQPGQQQQTREKQQTRKKQAYGVCSKPLADISNNAAAVPAAAAAAAQRQQGQPQGPMQHHIAHKQQQQQQQCKQAKQQPGKQLQQSKLPFLPLGASKSPTAAAAARAQPTADFPVASAAAPAAKGKPLPSALKRRAPAAADAPVPEAAAAGPKTPGPKSHSSILVKDQQQQQQQQQERGSSPSNLPAKHKKRVRFSGITMTQDSAAAAAAAATAGAEATHHKHQGQLQAHSEAADALATAPCAISKPSTQSVGSAAAAAAAAAGPAVAARVGAAAVAARSGAGFSGSAAGSQPPILSVEELFKGSSDSAVPESVTRLQLQQAHTLAQVAQKMVVVRCGSVLLAVDQHAADERVQLEALQHQLAQQQKQQQLAQKQQQQRQGKGQQQQLSRQQESQPAAADNDDQRHSSRGMGSLPTLGESFCNANQPQHTPKVPLVLQRQQLLPPVTMHLSINEAHALSMYGQLVQVWGWQVLLLQDGSEFGTSVAAAAGTAAAGTAAAGTAAAGTAAAGTAAAAGGSRDGVTSAALLQQVPVLGGVQLGAVDLQLYLHQLLETAGSRSQLPPGVLRVLKSKACRSAVMFGDSLSAEQSVELVKQLATTQLCFCCAHGRPTTAPLIDLAALSARLQQQADAKNLGAAAASAAGISSGKAGSSSWGGQQQQQERGMQGLADKLRRLAGPIRIP